MDKMEKLNINIPWVEKYRPNNFNDIVLEHYNKILIENIISNQYFPNMLLYGPPGTGKTTTIINLINSFQEKHNNPAAKLVLIAPATETSSAVARFCKFFSLSNDLKDAIFKLIEDRSGNKVSFYSIKRIAPLLPNPILWIHDKDDDITPLDDVKPILEMKLPNIEFMITNGLGHRKIYKDNQVVKKVVDFIS